MSISSGARLLPTAYLPPISYMKELVFSDNIFIEAHEHFVKQTIRNRCEIAGANGRLTLTVPVDHENRWRTPIGELRIAGDSPWNRIHLKSIRSAYGKSPFFEYYCDELESVLSRRHERLLDLNLELISMISGWLSAKTEIKITDCYTAASVEASDLRNNWNKTEISVGDQPAYHQVFSDRHGFIPDLSILDLVFNTGPEALNYLRSLK